MSSNNLIPGRPERNKMANQSLFKGPVGNFYVQKIVIFRLGTYLLEELFLGF